MKFIPYHKIKQFRDVVKDITFKSNYKGKNESGEPIYEDSLKPTLLFTGTVKLHGTNAGICYTPSEGIVAQKRKSFLNKNDLTSHYGFNQFVQVLKKVELTDMMKSLWRKNCRGNEQITLYGEWAGSNIQKGVAISELPKAFYYFDALVYNPDTEETRWVDIKDYYFNIEGVYNIYNFETYSLVIDFNKPEDVIDELTSITSSVEKECPVSKKLGANGIGEGVVWTAYWRDYKYIFKVKGKEHSVVKHKKMVSTTPEVLQNIKDFVEYACTENRVRQGMKELNTTSIKRTGDLLKWVANDILLEESDVLIKNNLEWKQVVRDINFKTREMFFKELGKKG